MGTVSGVDGFVNAFTVMVPSIRRAERQPSKIKICAILNIKMGTILPPRRMPLLNSVVTFTGELISLAGGIVVVAVDDISYFPCLHTMIRTCRCQHGRFIRGADVL